MIKTQQKMEDGRNIIYYSFVDEDDDDGEAAASPEVIGESEDDS